MIYKDSASGVAPGNQVWAKQILINIGLENLVDEVKPSNQVFQNDSWSCGLWVLKWIEMDYRARRQEPPIPVTVQMIAKRVNSFIHKLKEKAVVVPKAPPAPVPPAVPDVLPDPVGDKFKNLEDALDAAMKCKKCLPTLRGTKGCSTCMGRWFEEIRLQKVPKASLKKID